MPILDVPDLRYRARVGLERSRTSLHGVVEARPLLDMDAHQREFADLALKGCNAEGES